MHSHSNLADNTFYEFEHIMRDHADMACNYDSKQHLIKYHRGADDCLRHDFAQTRFQPVDRVFRNVSHNNHLLLKSGLTRDTFAVRELPHRNHIVRASGDRGYKQLILGVVHVDYAHSRTGVFHKKAQAVCQNHIQVYGLSKRSQDIGVCRLHLPLHRETLLSRHPFDDLGLGPLNCLAELSGSPPHLFFQI